ncbi:hypothetical protein PT015_23990 [Candidatus Mycobacterium wuenschmannii]|uniref:Phosphohydrolase n=1 Tax=Candidatus Mycobacterium wuenschmannii TaxID=3027808 RepID=A0ABY8VY48_9MYCO|nr:hypothetical protein [Candidatus Mycobacterium wuenschmannii]WIM87846.1 hypothetical protein PT015_23990 [Candidatus Mycobacterium wuenschmannii]
MDSGNVVTAHPIVEAVLDRHRDALGEHRSAYGNHVYRSLTYHQLLLGFSVPDTAALAWATHDLGIWTADTWDYLGPSADLAEAYAGEYGITDIDQLRALVTEHHRLRPLRDARVTETFRQADLIDVSRGVLTQGVGRAAVRAAVKALPYNGFHAFLAKGLSGYALRHPLRPLPMLRF